MKTLNKILILTVTILSCSENPISPDTESNFAIHLLKNTNFKIEHVEEMDLSKIELEPIPWLSSEDIIFYDFSSHCIYLKTSKRDYFPNLESPIFQIPEEWWQKPFIVTADDNPYYIGHFHPSVFVRGPKGLYITDNFGIDYADDILCISNSQYPIYENNILSSDEDERNNTDIKQALIDDNIFHPGIELKIDNVKIIENSDTSTIQYTFTITNYDKDNLYILDSDLMGTELFQFVSRGIVLWSEYRGYISSNEHIKEITPCPLDNWKSFWFTKIKSKQSITRTVSFKGYPQIAPGNYYCFLRFTSPLDIEKEERYLSDGRYWIGETYSIPMKIVVN